MCKDNIFPEKNNGFQALPGADFLPWPYSAAEKNDYFCDHKIESTMIRQYAGLVKFAHTIFAMPFALIGFVYALRTEGIPSDCAGRYGWVVLLLQVLLCMVFARNAAMGFNRWADRRIDRANPRTADREIPAGKISARAALRFVIVNALLFIVTASTINLLTGLLSPVALFVILMYSYCKRFTALAHLVLGLGLGIAPVGAYIAVTGHFAWPPCILALLDDLVRWLRHHLCVAGRRFRPQERPLLHPGPFFGTGVAPVQFSVACGERRGSFLVRVVLSPERLALARRRDFHADPRRRTPVGDPDTAAEYRHRFRHAQRHCEHGAGRLRNYRSFAGIKSGYFYTFAYSLSIIKYYTYYEYLL